MRIFVLLCQLLCCSQRQKWRISHLMLVCEMVGQGKSYTDILKPTVLYDSMNQAAIGHPFPIIQFFPGLGGHGHPAPWLATVYLVLLVMRCRLLHAIFAKECVRKLNNLRRVLTTARAVAPGGDTQRPVIGGEHNVIVMES